MQKNNFCSFAPPPTRVIERYGDSNITCSTPTPLKVASKIPDFDAGFKIDYRCRSDTAANALKNFNDVCKKSTPNFKDSVKCDNDPQTPITVTDAATNIQVTYYTCTGTCK
jgi:hypothetical protein